MTAYVFPGQGAQFKGMGRSLFEQFPEWTARADAILGYSLRDLCLHDPQRQLQLTQYTQPALYVVNALSYLQRLEQTASEPALVAGHSLGEYNALLAAGVIDFATGLRLVQQRGALMSEVGDGAMLAVIGLDSAHLEALIRKHELSDIDIANYNAPEQIVVAGVSAALEQARSIFESAGARCTPLNVSAAFHSRHMRSVQQAFAGVLADVGFLAPQIPVISNRYARPYAADAISQTLLEQISQPVQWTQSIQYMLQQGETEFEEIGPKPVLGKLIGQIRAAFTPAVTANTLAPAATGNTAQALGSSVFKQRYGTRYAYVAGAMYKGIASKQLVLRMARAGLLSYFGSGGLDLEVIEQTIKALHSELTPQQPFGMNLLGSLNHPQLEQATVDLYLRYGINNIEASGYLQMTPALLHYRLQGFALDDRGNPIARHRVLAKVSRPEIARQFLSPAPERSVQRLLADHKISTQQAQLARQFPVADDLCVEADSAGHTDRGIMSTLLPTMLRLRDEHMDHYHYRELINVGAAGGIGSPEAAAAAFIMGADFILTGSINQCTVEAGNSDAVKDLLQQMETQDTDYAPAGDLFELGGKIQVLKKASFFAARANKLYELYNRHRSLDDLDAATRQLLQEKYFHRSFEEVYAETAAYYRHADPQQLSRAERDPRYKMALIFKWYFIHTMRTALTGDSAHKLDYQIHCGPALGAFNQWVRGSELESWRNRHVDTIAEKMMQATAELLTSRARAML